MILRLPAIVIGALCATLIGSGEMHAAPREPITSDVLLRRQAWAIVRVVKLYGAAIRTAPSTNAATRVTGACNEAFDVLDVQAGWYYVEYAGVGRGWIGAGRVSPPSGYYPPFVSCGRGVTFQVGDIVAPSVARGCLSLRSHPSRQAQIDACVGNSARYVIYNGPFDPGTGEDWFYLVSPYNGGWALADYLVPSELPPGFVT